MLIQVLYNDNHMATPRSTLRKHVDSTLMVRLGIFALMGLIMFGIEIYDIAVSRITLRLAVLGIAIGIAVGIAAGRTFAITWHEDEAKVVARLDRTSFIIIVAYWLFSLFRRYVAGFWIHGPALLAFSFATIAGVTVGRLIFMSLHVRRVLAEQGISEPD